MKTIQTCPNSCGGEIQAKEKGQLQCMSCGAVFAENHKEKRMNVVFQNAQFVVCERGNQLSIEAEAHLLEEAHHVAPERLYEPEKAELFSKLKAAEQLGLKFQNGKSATEQLSLQIPTLGVEQFEALKASATASAVWQEESYNSATGNWEPTWDGGGMFIPDGGKEVRTQWVRTIPIEDLPGFVPQMISNELLFMVQGQTWVVKKRTSLNGSGGPVSRVTGLPPELLARALTEEQAHNDAWAKRNEQTQEAYNASCDADRERLRKELAEYLL